MGAPSPRSSLDKLGDALSLSKGAATLDFHHRLLREFLIVRRRTVNRRDGLLVAGTALSGSWREIQLLLLDDVLLSLRSFVDSAARRSTRS